jgi:transposase
MNAGRSTVGRPRKVTDQQVAIILEWHDTLLAWKKTRRMLKSYRQLAKDLRLSRGAVANVIQQRGMYKQPSPERRDMELRERRERMSKQTRANCKAEP